MEHPSASRAHQLRRLRSVAVEVGSVLGDVLFCQIWTPGGVYGYSRELRPVLLCVQAQSVPPTEAVKLYAQASATRGISAESMDLISDCLAKGATRLIESLEHIDLTQHPRDKLPGRNCPACSALFLPVFDAGVNLPGCAGSHESPTAVLEVLVCKSVQSTYNHSDLINGVCKVMDKHQFGINSDSTAFRKWSQTLSASTSPTPSADRRNSMSRTSSIRLLSSDDSDEVLTDAPCRRAQSGAIPDYAWFAPQAVRQTT